MGEIWEALQAASPITAIVYLSALLAFTASAVLLVVGLGLFSLGADLALDAVREQGARGGTTLTGRDVVNREASAFFGVPLHERKEILMPVVETAIRDKVLSALYHQMGMVKKAGGIVFNLPMSDVAE